MSDTTAPEAGAERNTRKLRQGVVVSATNDKTIAVEVERFTTDGLYGKTIKRTSKLYAHDETNDAGVGDTVRITETRPLSRTKRWRLQDIVERAK
jgi:small subunit ribosomal protein S17